MGASWVYPVMGFKILRTGSLLYRTYLQQVRSFPSKTNYLIISTKLKKTVDNINIRYNNTIINNVEKTKYLAIVIDNQLTFESYINNLWFKLH